MPNKDQLNSISTNLDECKSNSIKINNEIQEHKNKLNSTNQNLINCHNDLENCKLSSKDYQNNLNTFTQRINRIEDEKNQLNEKIK